MSQYLFFKIILSLLLKVLRVSILILTPVQALQWEKGLRSINVKLEGIYEIFIFIYEKFLLSWPVRRWLKDLLLSHSHQCFSLSLKILELEIFTFEFSIFRSIFKQTRLEWLDIKVGFEELTEV